MTFETENIEFKSQITDEIYKEVIAFANTDGGTVYVGVDNEGNVVGLDNIDDAYTRITNGIRDAIQPDVTIFVKYTLEDNNVVKVSVGEGNYKPYYLKGKGMKPSGVFVRQGTSSVPASPEQIRRMIKESDGDIFEEMRSMEQELTFSSAEVAFERYNTEFSTEKYRTLGITGKSENIYTNLAFILSDQCPYTIKIAVFGDEANTEFRDHKEFDGSVFKQFENTINYLALCNKTSSTIKGVIRTDKQDYPEEAIREALLNAIVHRDYSFSGSIIINVNDNRMEFISLGGLLPGLSTDDIRIGISQPRNKNLAEIFHRLRLVESYGTGIRRIYKLYEKCESQPVIEATANAFKIILPNMNNTVASETQLTPQSITPQMTRVIEYIKDNGQITDTEVQELLGIKKTRAYTLMKQMVRYGYVSAIGRGVNKKYVMPMK